MNGGSYRQMDSDGYNSPNNTGKRWVKISKSFHQTSYLWTQGLLLYKWIDGKV